jgi:tRNA nucleotidyltransferase (CCA-adding enzyme)
VPDLRDHLRALPCGAQLLDAAVPGTHLVGGAVRDLLRGERPHELDVAVVGDPGPLLAALGGEPRQHERFGTASVRLGDCMIDVAIARSETYAAPGALPEVEPGGLEEDLARRDFTVNAIALDLGDGTLREFPGAQDDLRAGRLRVLHDRSFLDDPTRLWRLARYAARLGFGIEPHTRALAEAAVESGAPATVSGNRIGNELRLALAEGPAALAAVVGLGLAPWLELDPDRIERALAILPPDGDPALTLLAAAAREPLPDLGLTAHEARAVRAARALRGAPAEPPSAAAAAFDGAPVEAVAATGTAQAERWLRADRHRRLAITGDDLVGAGIAPGPELGARLRAAQAALLDGDVGDDREAQLRVALASPA